MRKMTLREWLFEMEFDYEKDDNGDYHLIDLQGANLGDIESEVFTSKSEIVGRMDAYIHDYFVPYETNDDFWDKCPCSEFDFADIYDYMLTVNQDHDFDYSIKMLHYVKYPEELEDDPE